ncbi:MAG: exodeoxyribonuclease VII small subunit [Myxococcota bacterium]|jgi:exodeoxyribonuclease VII small subunit|nr:exodeoxyribonuclease VII small subunit [Myxococcota bacterium]
MSSIPDPFEAALNQLEAKVRALRDEQASPEETLRLFEEGVAEARHCHDLLEAVHPAMNRSSTDEDTPLGQKR